MTDPYGTPPGPDVPPYGQQRYGGPYAPLQNSQDAVVALVLSIAGFVVCPVVPSIIALVYAGRAEREIAASGGRLGGSTMVTAAKVLAWVELALVALVLVFFILFAVAFSTSG